MIDIEKDAKAMLETAKLERQNLSKKAEPKDAAPAPSAEIKKTEEKKEEPKEDKEAKVIADAEAKAKKDEEILSKKDEELKDDEKVRKAELVKIKDEGKNNTQKRFDELTAKIKALEGNVNATKAEKDALASELTAIKTKLSMTPEDKTKEEVKSEIQARNKKYVDEDKEKPREDKREMTKDELDEWLLEDYEGASEWLTRRSIRRYREEEAIKQDKSNDRQATEIMTKQNRSAEKTYAKYPELDVFKRGQELKSQGKSKEEALQILFKESPKFKVYMDVISENPEKYMLAENGPELIVEEMEKRLAPKGVSEVDELKKRIAELEETVRLREVDGEISSTRHAEPKSSEPEIVKKTEELGESVGLSKEQVKKALERRGGRR